MLAARQLTFDWPTREGLDADDYLITEANRTAFETIGRWPYWPSIAVILEGPHGSGKTHLTRIWAERAGALLLDSASVWSAADPLGRLSGHDCCVIDDADLVDDHVLLLHIYNDIAARGGNLLLTASRPLAGWGVGLPDLSSRLRTAWTVGIGLPGDDLLGALLAKQLRDRQLSISPDVMGFLMRNMERSFASARRLVQELDRASLRARRPITLPLARAVLQSLMPTEVGEVATGDGTEP